LRDRYEEFRAKGAEVVVIGMGTPKMAATFGAKLGIPFPLLVDRKLCTYRAMGLRKGSVGDVVGPKVWARGTRILLRGRGIAVPKQNAYQLGGSAVIGRGGAVRFVHKAKNSSDFPPIDALLAAIQ
jgi:peroxiredoxin